MMLVCSVAVALVVVRIKAPQPKPQPQTPTQAYDPNKPGGLKLFDGKVAFVANSMQTVDLRLPCSGLLKVSFTCPKGSTICAFVVPREEFEKMKTRQTCKHVEGFDAKSANGNYQQAAEVAPGCYSLVLLDESMSHSVIQVRAQLTDLK